MKVVTILSDSPTIPTGYRNQALQLCQYLESQDYKVHWLANAFIGTTLDGLKLESGEEIKAKVYGSAFGQDYFQNTMSQHLKETKTDIFIILLDTFMLYPWFLNIDTSPAKTFFWFPSDGGGGMPKGCEQILKKVDCPVAMAKFGQKQVWDYYQIKTNYIPHGIDINKFYKIPNEERNLLRAKWGLNGKFVIGVVARNQPRKNLDRTIKMMALLRDRLPNAVLLLHLDPNDPAQQMFNVPSLIQKYGLENRIIFTGMRAHKGVDVKTLNEIYNIMDIFLLTTSGEGFGIPIIEAMSAQVPVLATDYTTTQELVKDNLAGLGIKLSGCEEIDWNKVDSKQADLDCLDGTITGSWEVERGFCSIKDCVEKLVYLEKNEKLRTFMGLSGRKACEEKYDFRLVGKQWESLWS